MHRRVDLEVSVRTDADGRYLAENLPAGRYFVRPELPPELRVSKARTRVRRDEHRVRDLVVTRRHSRKRDISWFKRKR